MRRFRNIMVGIDFSQASKAALKAAVRLARFDKSAVTLCHIVEPELAEEICRVNGFTNSQLLRHMEDSVWRFLGGQENFDPAMGIHLTVEHPLAGLISACQCRNADLLVLGTRGIQQQANQVGAVAAQCIRKAPADVLLVREDAEGPFRKALVGVDFSRTSARAVQAAGHLAQGDGTELDCVFVYRPPIQIALAMEYGGSVPELPDWRACLNAWSEDLKQFVAPILRPLQSVDWRTELITGAHIRQSLIAHAQENGVDLVVMGTRGRTNLVDLLIGTTAESMVRHASCSILAVKLPEVLAANDGFHPPPHELLRSNQDSRLLP